MNFQPERTEQALKEEGLRESEILAIKRDALLQEEMLRKNSADTKKKIAKDLFMSNLRIAADSFGVAKELAKLGIVVQVADSTRDAGVMSTAAKFRDVSKN